MKQIKKIAVVSPSVMCSERKIEVECWLSYLQSLGLEVEVLPTVLTTGTRLKTFQAKEKAKDIMSAYLDDSVDALVAAYGGASALRVLEYLDFETIKKHNKPIIGFSDTTSVQLGVFAKTGNPYVTGFAPEYELRSGKVASLVEADFKRILQGKFFEAVSGNTVHGGVAEGVLIGGCLSPLSDLSGTPYYPDLTDKILLIEDVEEVSYKLKLMLTQLKYQPSFSGVKGIVFGRWRDCLDHLTQGTVESVVEDFAAQVDLPMIKDFNYGHFEERHVLTCGVKYRLDATSCRLEQIEE